VSDKSGNKLIPNKLNAVRQEPIVVPSVQATTCLEMPVHKNEVLLSRVQTSNGVTRNYPKLR